MARRSWVYIDGVAYERGVDAIPERDSRGRVIAPDLPDFVSPIDGKVYSGRAGLREHCAKHDVVPTADLAGLPPLPRQREIVRSREQIAQNKRTIAEIINSRT